jgi:guanylate kinase
MLILDEQGLENIQNKLGRDNIISILIEADETVRLYRSLNRDEATEQNTREIKRRIKDDDIKFKNRSLYDYILTNNNLDELQKNIEFILSLNLK